MPVASLPRRGVVIAWCLVVASAALPAHALEIALGPLVGAGAGGDAERLAADLRGALAARDGVRVQPERDTADATMAAMALEGECDASTPSCLGRIARVAVVEQIVGGTAAPSGGGWRLSLSLVTARGDVIRSANVDVPSAGPPRSAALDRIAIQLLQPQLDGAFLRVLTEPTATLVLDGQILGTASRNAVKGPVGKHRLEIVAVGFETAVREVELRYGDTVELSVPLRRLGAGGEAPPDEPALVEPPLKTKRDAPDITVAILGIENRGDDPHVVRWLTEALAAEVRKRERVVVVDRAAGVAKFGALGDSFAQRVDECAGLKQCVAGIAEELGVDLVVVGYSARTADGRFVYLEGVPFSDGVVGLYAEGKVLGRKLDRYAQLVGSLVSELLPDYGLVLGERAGVTAAQRYALDPPPVPAVIFLGAAGLAGVSAIAAGGLGAVYLAGTLEAPASTSVGVLALSAVGAMVGAGALTAVMLPFTDWGPPEQ